MSKPIPQKCQCEECRNYVDLDDDPFDERDPDDELEETDPVTVQMLGFDPKEMSNEHLEESEELPSSVPLPLSWSEYP